MARISAATWPTRWRSAPFTTISVGPGVCTVMPAGISLLTACEKPTARFSLLPCAAALKPTPTRDSFFSKPLVTPSTMLFTSWRMVPLMALASRDSSAGTKDSLPSLLATFTRAFWASDSVPPAPLTLIWSSLICTSTPWGTATGIFPTRDISRSFPLGHVAQHFAADAVGARLAVGHHALGGGDDGDAETVLHLRDRVATLVDAQAGTADALDALDHRAAGVVLQRDLELALVAVLLDLEAVDVALVLQDLGDRDLEVGSGHGHRRLGHHLRIADAGQQVGDGITHAHVCLSSPLTSWPWSRRGCRRRKPSRGSCCGPGRTGGTFRADDR